MDNQNQPDPQTEIEHISSLSTRNDRLSWERKMNNMVALLADLAPIEEQILDLLTKKQQIFDQVAALRTTMVKECIHPHTHLEYQEDHVLCKFCDRKIVRKA